MSFSLSQADRDLLNQTIAKVNALTLSKKQGEQKNQKTKDHTYVELSENVLDGGDPTSFWYGVEVGFNEDGDPIAKPQGRIWDIDSKSLVILGTPAVDDVVRIEPTSLANEEPVWIGNKTAGGGGDSSFWIKNTSASTGSGSLITGTGNLYSSRFGDVLESVTWIASQAKWGQVRNGYWLECSLEDDGTETDTKIYVARNIPTS